MKRSPSWPGLTRPSTLLVADGRVMPGRDDVTEVSS
jgi:hypothetical protein